ncbi:MAG: M48 family metalloprotease, partial [Gemmataceae bacterium]
MPISVTCSCGKKLNAPDTLAGKRAKCPACQTLVLIPEPLEVIEDEVDFIEELPQQPAVTKTPAKPPQTASRATIVPPRKPATKTTPKPTSPVPPVTTPTERFAYLSKRIDSAFTQDRIEPVRTPLGYRLAVLAVSVLMILLPLIYLALIAAVAYGVWYHAVNHTSIFTSGTTTSAANRGKEIAGRFMLYLTPILAGGILILFMLKPLFAKALPRPGRRSLKKEDEPLLFDFVARVCDAVGSPKPTRIDIDNQVNASASFRSGFRSFLGNDLVLTIGMPLAAGLNMRQFGGVLAHEFGHFAQGAGMRLSFVIRSINFWFDRVVNERDQWDDKLKDWSSSLDLRIGWMLYLARFGVWLTRKLLWCLMMAGHFFSGVLMRQMEFDADRHEARFAGCDAFASTARQLHILNLAENGAMSDLGDFHQEGRLGDNLPKLILLNIDQMPAELKTKVDLVISESTTGLFDTHPADSARIQCAKREETEGIFRLELPAGNLFRDFDQTSKDVTWDFYHEIFGEALDKSDIHPVEGLVERQKTEQQTMTALTRFFRCKPLMFRPMPN